MENKNVKLFLIIKDMNFYIYKVSIKNMKINKMNSARLEEK